MLYITIQDSNTIVSIIFPKDLKRKNVFIDVRECPTLVSDSNNIITISRDVILCPALGYILPYQSL